MSWPTYSSYKPCEVPWLHEIPASWEVDKFRHCFRESNEKNGPTPTGEMLSISGYRGVEIKEYDDDNRKRTVEEIEEYRVVRRGQLAVNTMWLNHAGLGVSSFEGHISPAYRSYWISHHLEPRFVHHLMRSSAYVDGYTALLTGIRPNSLQLSRDDLMSFPVLVPPRSDQLSIAGFLDRETAKIDALIDKQEQLIATLREDRAATITQAVTKGLDSRGGISSSGDQGPPSHWAQGVPLKRLAEVQTGLTLGRSVSPETAVTIPYLRVANVQVGRVDLTEVTEVAIDRSEVARYRLRAGDVLMTEGGDIDKLGRGCLWQGEIDPCLHQNHVFAVRCSENLDARFLVYLLDTAPAREYFTLTAKKTTNLASTNSTTLGRFSFPVPPIAEQKAIVRFLDERCSKIDALIGKSTEMIETLREYRSALITNAVTGKIDVREGV